MSKSTRGAHVGRAGFEYFDRRQTGPWLVLRLLFRGPGWLASFGLAVLMIVGFGLDLFVVLGLMTVLFLGSFAVVWRLAGLLIRARAFLFVLVVLAAVNWGLQSLFGELAGNLVLCGLLVGLFIVPWTRRFLVSRFWCVLDRHRIRACLKVCKVRTMNLDGSLPLMLWARPTKTGERVWLWIRAGASGDDIEDALSFIAAACFARDARIHRVRKLSTIVAVEIIRRDPLSTGEKVPSPLSMLSDVVNGTATGEGTEPIRPLPVVEITEADWGAAVPEPRRSSRKPAAAPAEPARPTVIVSGEDLSDYVD